MISAGLHLTDLNLFDGTSELLITSMHQTREIENAIEKVRTTNTISIFRSKFIYNIIRQIVIDVCYLLKE